MKFGISSRARRQIERIHRWWMENRPAAASLFLDELDAAGRLLRANPEIGIVYIERRSSVIRRLLLVDTEYHVYYRHVADGDELVVIAVWGASRGRGPRI